MFEEKNYEAFEKLIENAERYIVDNAEKVILAVRNNNKDNINNYSERCKNLLSP
ncbi:MAG: hypothetical protein ACI37T_06465 [Candidatus Gastranaerophilaceae bacterium]